MRVSLKGMLVVLTLQLVGECFADFSSGYIVLVIASHGGSFMYDGSALTHASGPQAECGWDLLDNGLAVFDLAEKDSVIANFLDTGVGQHLDTITSESALGRNVRTVIKKSLEYRKHTSAYLESASS
jgi:hypothetical protein